MTIGLDLVNYFGRVFWGCGAALFWWWNRHRGLRGSWGCRI